jgi:excisionase family DNA binding protein
MTALPKTDVELPSLVELPALLDVKQVAQLLGVSASTVPNWVDEGAMPAPVRIGRRLTRWNAAKLQRWIDAGCPFVERNRG